MKGCIALVVCVAAVTAWTVTADAKDLSITTIKEDPYAMTRGSELEGFCMDLLSELSKQLDFKYNVHVVKDSRYGALDSSGSWTGMIGEIVRGEADLAVAPLTITAIREGAVDMTTPFMHTGLSFIVHKDLVCKESSFSLLAPFSTDMWVGILVAFLLTGLCIFLVGRISPTEWAEPGAEEHSFTLLHSFWYLAGALTLQGAGPHPKGLSGRVVSAIWWLFAVMLLACYFANFNSAKNSNNKPDSITSFEDLANQDAIEYGTIDGGSSKYFFKNSKNSLYQRIYDQMERKKSFVSSLAEGVRRAQKGNFAFIGEEVSLDLVVARNCDLVRAQSIIGMRGYAIAAPQGSPLIKNLSIAILKLSESGDLTHLRHKWWASSCERGDMAQTHDALNHHDLRSLFLLLGLGLGVGVLLALLELMSRARSQAKESKKSCCSVLTAELSQRFGRRGASAEQDNADKNKA